MNNTNSTSSKTLWHRLLAKLLELLLIPVKILVHNEILAAAEPPKIDILLLRNEEERWNEEQRALLPDGIRDRHMKNHILECKITESATNQAFQQLLVYDYLYRGSKELALDELQCYLVSSKTPLAERMAEWGYEQAENPGVYVTKTPVLDRIVLLILNELREEPHNDYFRLFASRKPVRISAFTRLRQAGINISSEIMNVLFTLRKAYDLEEINMGEEITFEELLKMGEAMRKEAIATAPIDEYFEGERGEEVRKYALATAPIDEHFEGEKGEEVRKYAFATAPIDEYFEGEKGEEVRKHALATASIDERLEGMEPEKRLVGLDIDEMQALMKQIEVYLNEQDATVTPVEDEPRAEEESLDETNDT